MSNISTDLWEKRLSRAAVEDNPGSTFNKSLDVTDQPPVTTELDDAMSAFDVGIAIPILAAGEPDMIFPGSVLPCRVA